MLILFHRLIRRKVSKSSLPCEEDWEGIHIFDSTGCMFLAIGEFLKKTQFQSLTLCVVKASVVKEIEKASQRRESAKH